MSEDREWTDFSLDRGRNVVAFLHDAFIYRVAETCAESQINFKTSMWKKHGMFGLQMDMDMDIPMD